MVDGHFHEEDEPVTDVVAAFDAGFRLCEFATGEVIMTSAPSVTLCGKPGVARQGVMWCDVHACDECYARWLSHPSRARTRDHGDEE